MAELLAPQDPLSRPLLARLGAAGSGEFDGLARPLADILLVVVGLIVLCPDRTRAAMRMLAFCLDERMRPPLSYPLSGTPCAQVVGRQFLCLPSGARREFPDNDLFRKLGLDAYAAYPLSDAAGQPIGLIGAMHRGRLDNAALCESILKIFGVRAVAELERSEEQ